jgi:AbrB family looped-hinge helix DNA binding protein
MKKVTIDRTGRVIIPKPLREALRLEPGDGLEVNISAKEITLRPVQAETPLVKEQGVWVYRMGRKVHRDALLQLIYQVRDERIGAQ